MDSLYRHSESQPFHISVGAVLVNDEGEICVHAIPMDSLSPNVRNMLGDLSALRILMRETLENGETLEQAVLRGIREEFGAEGIVKKYLGSIQGTAMDHPSGIGPFEKTTLYFQVVLTKLGERPKNDAEAHSALEWLKAEDLIEKMKQQATPARGDVDESKIIEAYLKYGNA